jgi:hypothetical protein
MLLKNALATFIDRVQQNDHLHPLLVNQDVIVQVCADHESYTVHVAEGDIHIREKEESFPHVVINGIMDEVIEILGSSLKLRTLLKMNNVQFKGSYRHLLLLEAIIHLAKPFEGNIQKNNIFRKL